MKTLCECRCWCGAHTQSDSHTARSYRTDLFGPITVLCICMPIAQLSLCVHVRKREFFTFGYIYKSLLRKQWPKQLSNRTQMRQTNGFFPSLFSLIFWFGKSFASEHSQKLDWRMILKERNERTNGALSFDASKNNFDLVMLFPSMFFEKVIKYMLFLRILHVRGSFYYFHYIC